MDARTRNFVRDRADGVCEYCGMRQDEEPFYRFHIDHVKAKQHGGTDHPDNLAIACHHCNSHKGTNLSAIDPESGRVVPLFNPREQRWADHFACVGSLVRGRTPVGRAAMHLLKMNDPSRAVLRVPRPST